MTSNETVFITGANGYLGGHVIREALAAGYRVRATARGSRIPAVKATFAKYGTQFEVVQVDDVADGDITPYLNGVTALIHTAAPVPDPTRDNNGRDNNVFFDSAVNGTTNVIKQAIAAGVKKIVYTSSIATAYHPGQPSLDTTWNPVTKEDALRAGAGDSYRSAKTYAEKALWELADKHAQEGVDVTVFNPPFLLGPAITPVVKKEDAQTTASTASQIYWLIGGQVDAPIVAGYADVRDVARLHVYALGSKPDPVRRKRIIVYGRQLLSWSAAVELISKARPGLRSRLVAADDPRLPKLTELVVDHKRIEDVLGFTKDQFHNWQDTVIDTIDFWVEQERNW